MKSDQDISSFDVIWHHHYKMEMGGSGAWLCSKRAPRAGEPAGCARCAHGKSFSPCLSHVISRVDVGRPKVSAQGQRPYLAVVGEGWLLHPARLALLPRHRQPHSPAPTPTAEGGCAKPLLPSVRVTPRPGLTVHSLIRTAQRNPVVADHFITDGRNVSMHL